MAGVIWGFHRDGYIGRFQLPMFMLLVLSPNFVGFFKDIRDLPLRTIFMPETLADPPL
jgi:hypothetical protein